MFKQYSYYLIAVNIFPPCCLKHPKWLVIKQLYLINKNVYALICRTVGGKSKCKLPTFLDLMFRCSGVH